MTSHAGLEAPSESVALKRSHPVGVGQLMDRTIISCISDDDSDIEIIATVPTSSGCAESRPN